MYSAGSGERNNEEGTALPFVLALPLVFVLSLYRRPSAFIGG
jgi:hypothetical protein